LPASFRRGSERASTARITGADLAAPDEYSYRRFA
jgi:hypothetical protein